MHTFHLTPFAFTIAAAFLALGAGHASAGACPGTILPFNSVPPCDLNSSSVTIPDSTSTVRGITVTGQATFIDNAGQITGSPAAITVNAGSSINTILNNTVLGGTATGSIFGSSSGIEVNGGVGTLNNLGSISASSGYGVVVNKGGDIGRLVNSSTGVIGQIKINAGGGISNGIANQGAIGQISNEGLIYSSAIAISQGSSSVVGVQSTSIAGIQNAASGAIIGGSTAINIIGGTLPTITNDGLISGTTAINSTIENVSVSNNGLLQGRLNMTGAGSTVTNTGVVWLSENAAASTINGTYTQSSKGAALYINAASASSYGQLNVSGAALVNGGIQVVLPTSHTIAAGQTLSNVVTAGTLTGNAFVKDNSLNLDFAKVQDGQALSLAAVAVTANGPVSSTVAPGTVTQSGTVTAIAPGTVVKPIVSPATDSAYITHCSQPGSNCSVPTTTQGIQQVARNIEEPVIVGGTQQATMTVMRDINRVVQARRESNLGLSSGDGFYDDSHVWMRPFGSWTDQKERGGVSGYDARTGGIMIGTDGLVSEKTRAGAALTYAKVNLDGNSSIQPQTADVSIWNLLGYGSYAIDDVTDVNFHVGYGHNANKGQRTIITSLTNGNNPVASSKYDSQVATAGVGLGRTLMISPQTRFIPSVRADYVWIKDDGYSENGASPFNLQVDGNTASSLVFAVDGRIRHDIAQGLSLFANLGIGYDVINDQASINALIAGQPGGYSTYYGIDQSPWITRGGLALVGNPSASFEYGIYYDVEYRTDYLNQTASAKLRWAF